MPCEFVNNFDPSYPVIIGGLLPGEGSVGYIQVYVSILVLFCRIINTLLSVADFSHCSNLLLRL